MVPTRASGLVSRLALLALLGGLGTGSPSAASAHAALSPNLPIPPDINSLLVDPAHPRTVYAAGNFGFLRSQDAGSTWATWGLGLDLREHFLDYDVADAPEYLQTSLGSLAPASGGSTMLATLTYTPQQEWGGLSPGRGFDAAVVRSTDGGATWTAGSGDISTAASYGTGLYSPMAGPLRASRAYARFYDPAYDRQALESSADGGKTWKQTATPPGVEDGFVAPSAIVPDATQPARVYADFTDDAPAANTTVLPGWARSDDGGLTWSTVVTPTDTPALADYALDMDPVHPGMVEARTKTKGVPANRRYLSTDGGQSWTASTCPGTWKGGCSNFILPNVFGAGQSYAFYADGVHAFKGAGAAGPALSKIAPLPVPLAKVAAIAGGNHAGDPVYVLTQEAYAGAVPTTALYVSTDGGKSWHAVQGNLLPNVEPPSTTPGVLLAPATKHAVGAPFVALYRKLGTRIAGYPVTEAYYQGTVLTQEFEHLRLQLVHGKAAIAPLGIQGLTMGITSAGQPDPKSLSPAPPGVKSTIPVGPAFKQFWQQYGGAAVFGWPITAVFQDTNSDGTGAIYTMQYFQNARLESHPDVKNPQYRILLGQLGTESLMDRDWLTFDSGSSS